MPLHLIHITKNDLILCCRIDLMNLIFSANSRIEQIKTEYERERIKMEASVKRLEIENRSLQVKYNDKVCTVTSL